VEIAAWSAGERKLRVGLRQVAVLRKKKGPKAKKRILETLLRDMHGTPAQKLALFERLKAAGAFVNESAAELGEAEKTLREFVSGGEGVWVRARPSQ
jgi:hypothetical protein